MKRSTLMRAVCIHSALGLGLSALAQAPQLINYQGRLLDGTNLVNGSVGLSLRLFNVASGGTSLYEDSNTVTVADGLYATFIGDHPTNAALLVALTNTAVWVEVAVNGTTLAPRERLASVGYSLATRGLLAAADGIIVLNPALGTNAIDGSAAHAAILGGLRNGIGTNADYSTIGGGYSNAVVANSLYATIAGGSGNTIGKNSNKSAISGGEDNHVADNSAYAAIAGGLLNEIRSNADYSVIGGGSVNTIQDNSLYAVIPGGRENAVGTSATNAFAAGRRAKANHRGTFVWADDTNANFASTTNNQFLIRAGGGVGIGTAVTTGAALTVAGAAQFSGDVAAASFAGNGAALTGLAGTQLVAGSVGSAEVADGSISNADVAANTFWNTTGNAGTTTGTHFLGTTDNQPVEIRVNNLRAALIQPSNGAPNIVLGAAQNAIAGGTWGASILGGGENAIGTASLYGLVAGGRDNHIGTNAFYSVIGGGFSNTVADNSEYAVIVGGWKNDLGSGAESSVIGGGVDNNVGERSSVAVIAGGWQNDIGTNTFYAVIGGGSGNNVGDNLFFATIAGGWQNEIRAEADQSTISGGRMNRVADLSEYAVIAGGYQNDIGTNSDYAVIGGGWNNNVAGDSPYAAIPGGRQNNIGNDSDYTFIGGGYDHNVASNSQYATIAGGSGNQIGSGAPYAAIGGGYNNQIALNSAFAMIPGGRDNFVGVSATNALAAGRRASALHRGTFVWADDTNADFASTSNNQFLVRAAGGVGINHTAPEGTLHVLGGSAGSVTARVDSVGVFESDGDGFISVLVPTNATAGLVFGSEANSGDSGVYYNTGDTRDLRFRVGNNNARMTITTNGNVGIGTTAPTGLLHVAGNAYAAAWLTTSDRHAKQDIVPVDAAAILEKISALPVATWSFKTEPDVKHLGPMAQDFRAAFGLGPSETAIATVDADGVALAAIQALAEQNAELRVSNAELKARTDALEARLRALEAK